MDGGSESASDKGRRQAQPRLRIQDLLSTSWLLLGNVAVEVYSRPYLLFPNDIVASIFSPTNRIKQQVQGAVPPGRCCMDSFDGPQCTSLS